MTDQPSTEARFRVRPLRLSFLVHPNDLESVREAIQISTALWGGRFNSIIPVFRRSPARYKDQWIGGPSASKFLEGMIDAFEPDFVVPMTADLTPAASSVIDPGRVVLPTQIFSQSDEDEPITLGVSTWEVFAHLYEEQFQFVLRHPPKVIIPKATDPRFSALTAAVFGEFPTSDRLKFLAESYVRLLDAKGAEVTAANLLTLFSRETIYPLRIGSSFLDTRQTAHFFEPSLFYMKHDSIADLIDYWNLRAIGWRILPLPREWSKEMVGQCEEFIAKVCSQRGNGHKNGVVFVCSRSNNFDEMTKYVSGLKRPDGDRLTIDPRFPRMWEEWGRDADHASRIIVTHETSETSRITSWSNSVTFSEVLPEFVDAHGLRRIATCANIVEGLPGAAAFIPPGIRSLHTWLGESGAHEAWVSREGVTLACSSYRGHRMWNLPTPFSIFQAWMKEKGFEIELSGAGKIAAEVIETLGGLHSTHLLAHEELIKMFGDMAHARFEFPETEDATNTSRTLIGKTVPRASLVAILTRANPKHQRAVTNHFKALTGMGCLRLGMRIQCQHCAQHNWYGIGELNEKLTCERCLKTFKFPVNSPPMDAWHYRAAGPFSIEGYAQGGFCVALTMGKLLDQHWTTSTWITNFNIAKAGKHFYEADFGIFLRDDSAFTRGNNVFLIVGECKSFDRFTARDFQRMRELAKAFPGAVLVFSTFRRTLTSSEKRAIKAIANRGRRPLGGGRCQNPVMVLTGIELFSREKIPYCWKEAGPPYDKFAERHLVSEPIESICDITQQVHLGMEPFHEWREKRRKTKWERMQKKIKGSKAASTAPDSQSDSDQGKGLTDPKM